MTHFQSRKLAIAIAIAAAGAGLSAAHAQPAAKTFTFQSQATAQTVVGSDGTGPNPYVGTFVTGKIQTAFADGTKTSANYTCVSMTQPPHGKLFDMHMLCDATDSNGTYSATMGCTILDAAAENFSCIGGLYGKSGSYVGRRGTFTNHTVGGAGTGTGQWYN